MAVRSTWCDCWLICLEPLSPRLLSHHSYFLKLAKQQPEWTKSYKRYNSNTTVKHLDHLHCSFVVGGAAANGVGMSASASASPHLIIPHSSVLDRPKNCSSVGGAKKWCKGKTQVKRGCSWGIWHVPVVKRMRSYWPRYTFACCQLHNCERAGDCEAWMRHMIQIKEYKRLN